MRLLFARHGETDWNVAGKIQGSTDIPLNGNGKLQARALAGKIRDMNVPGLAVYTSRQKRAFQTAEIVAEMNGAPCSALEGLEEIGFGRWEGRSWKEIRESDPEEYGRWHADRRYDASHGGESYQAMLDRVAVALREIVRDEKGVPLIVSHGGVILSLKCLVTGTPFSEMHKQVYGNAEIFETDSETLLGKLS